MSYVVFYEEIETQPNPYYSFCTSHREPETLQNIVNKYRLCHTDDELILFSKCLKNYRAFLLAHEVELKTTTTVSVCQK